MNKKKWLLVPLLLVLVLIIGYCYQSIRFQSQFLPKTAIGNTDISGLSEKDAKEKLQTSVDAESFTVLNDGKEWKVIPKKELGMEYDLDATVSKAMSNQNSWLWFMSYIKTPEKGELVSKGYNQKAVDTALVAVNKELETFNKSRTKTTNASVEHKDGKFQIIPEIQGDSIDEAAFIKAAKNDLTKGAAEIELTKYIAKPTILATDESLKKEMDTINQIAEINGSYSINGQDVVIPKEKIASWVVYKDGKIDLKEDEVRKYVEELGATHNTSTNDSKFKSTKRGEVSVPSGALSWTIATDNEVAGLTEAVLAGKDFNGRVPAAVGSGTPGGPLVGNTYIEVDIQAQHMWYYKDGAVALETPVITGKPSTPTPPGMFYVWNKQKDQILRGGEIPSPVDFWMPIDWTGVGIHDSSWQNPNSYGGDSYLTVGSHGCINTPPSVCAKLYDMIDVGVPVIVF